MNWPSTDMTRKLGWLWLAALAAFVVSALGLSLAMVVPGRAVIDIAMAVPPSLAGFVPLPPSPSAAPILAPFGAGLIALLSAALALLSAPVALARAVGNGTENVLPDEGTLIADMTASLHQAREQLERTRAASDAVLSGGAAASDLERRLITVAHRLERATGGGLSFAAAQKPDAASFDTLRQAGDMMRRMGEHLERMDRLERSLPEVVGSITQAAAAADSGLAKAAQRVGSSTDLLERKVAAMAAPTAAAERIEAATARLGEVSSAVLRASADLAALPSAAARVESLATGLAQTSNALTRTGADLAVLLETTGRAEQTAGLAEAAETVLRIGETLRNLPDASDRIKAAATHLEGTSHTLSQASMQLLGIADAAAQIEAVTADLGSACAKVALAGEHAAGAANALAAANSAVVTLTTVSDRLDMTSDALLRQEGKVEAQVEASNTAAVEAAAIVRTLAETARQIDAVAVTARTADLDAVRAVMVESNAGLASALSISEWMQKFADRLDFWFSHAQDQATNVVAQVDGAGVAVTRAASGLFDTVGRLDGLIDRAEAHATMAEPEQADAIRQIGNQVGALRDATERAIASVVRLDEFIVRVDAQAVQRDLARACISEGLEVEQSVMSGAQQSSCRHGCANLSFATSALLEVDEPEDSNGLVSALSRIGRVESEVEHLARETELLAEHVMTQGGPAVPSVIVERAPEFVESVERTIRRLQSVSTAVALACDGVN